MLFRPELAGCVELQQQRSQILGVEDSSQLGERFVSRQRQPGSS
jgi:hypothetical protein